MVFVLILKFICNGFLEKCMPDDGFGIYVFWRENREFCIGFLRGLSGASMQTRGDFAVFVLPVNSMYIGCMI